MSINNETLYHLLASEESSYDNDLNMDIDFLFHLLNKHRVTDKLGYATSVSELIDAIKNFEWVELVTFYFTDKEDGSLLELTKSSTQMKRMLIELNNYN